MKAVITGANSFIGKKLSDALRRAGWDIVQVSRRPFPCDEGMMQIYLPMEAYHRLGELTGGCDCFFHLAWSGTRGGTRMDRARQQENLCCSVNGLHAMLEAGCGCVITAGSQAEYGPCSDQITEQTPCAPNTEYGKAKLAFYEQVQQACEKARTAYKEPRFFSLYGPGDFAGTMVISTLVAMLENKPCPLTAGVQMWDFLYIDDAVDALAQLGTRPCANGVYNFGSGDVRRLKDYVLEMAEITGTQSELQFGAVPYPETGMVSLWPDVSKLQTELQWTPKTRFADGIRAVLQSLQQEKRG